MRSMIITYHSGNFLRFQLGDTTVAVNPDNLGKGEKGSRFGADIVLCSVNDPSIMDIDRVAYGSNDPFVINGAGDYEVKNVPIIGVGMRSEFQGASIRNTAYRFRLDDIDVGVIGLVDNPERLTATHHEELGDVDIVVVSLGVGMSPSQAYSIAKSFSPQIIIPVGAVDDDIVRKVFLDEAGSETKAIDKLTIRSKDLIGKEAEVVVLSAQ